MLIRALTLPLLVILGAFVFSVPTIGAQLTSGEEHSTNITTRAFADADVDVNSVSNSVDATVTEHLSSTTLVSSGNETSSLSSPNSIGDGSGPKQHITEHEIHQLGKLLQINPKRLPTLKKVGRRINSLIDRVHSNDGYLRPEYFVHEFLPDPLPVKDIVVEEEEGFFTSYNGVFTNVELHGISGVKIHSIRANVGKFTAKIVIHVPDVFLTGNYTLDGQVTFVNINGAGNFRMNISDIEIDAFGNLKRVLGEDGKDHLQIGEIELDVEPADMDLVYENLSVLGSETIAETIVGTMSGLIFSQVKSTVLDKTSSKIRDRINERLWNVPFDIIEHRQETLFDDMVAFVAGKLGDRLEPLKLPKVTRNVAARLLVLNVNASVNIHNGALHGLTTIARTGDIYVTYEDDALLIEADVGFKNLTGSYDWDLKVLGRGPSGSASLAIKKISAYLRIRQELKRGSVPMLERFHVEDIDHVWMDMNGLGVWDYLLEIIVNTVSNTFRVTIANLIAGSVTQIIKEEIVKAQISFIP